MKVELIKDLGDGWTTGLAYTKAWDKDGYYRNYSNGEPDAPISNPIDSTFTVSVKKYSNLYIKSLITLIWSQQAFSNT